MNSWEAWKILYQGTMCCLLRGTATQHLNPWPLPNQCCKAVPGELLLPFGLLVTVKENPTMRTREELCSDI